ncbi:hypothetical protein Tsubulata_029538 [Turnera subulata]|uniref:DUF4283 domain-containing protein n=1 Tax=Turnera subulata TaxID=218843 RepID=A0A9Q0JQH5_9ROSI|nr:hypothetical protein Tsubulata_029538 [Turnera subulata]
MASLIYDANGLPCAKSALIFDLGKVPLPKPSSVLRSQAKIAAASVPAPVDFSTSPATDGLVSMPTVTEAKAPVVLSKPAPIASSSAASPGVPSLPVELCTSWAKVVSSSPASPQLQFVEPVYSDDNSTVRIPPELIDLGRQKYSLCLIGQFMGGALKLGFMHAILNKLWGRDGPISVSPYKDGLFLFQFPNAATLSRALYRGPWHVGGIPLMLWPWSSNAQKLDNSSAIFPVWVKLKHVPLELLTKEGLSYLASVIGTPLHADQDCSKLFRGDSANICILVDFSKPLKHVLTLDFNGAPVEIDVAYSWQPQRCEFCNAWGHHELACGFFKSFQTCYPFISPASSSLCNG